MKGKILEYNEEGRNGIISADDGSRYKLDISEWKGSSIPKAGNKVDFSVNGENAASIYAESALADGASKRIIAALFAFFLGVFGAHKFYLGRTKEGVIMLLVFLLGFVLFGLPSLIIAIIAFVEFVLYLIKSDEQFEQLYVLDKKAWF
ncbi:TM2 domain-containing protein [Candidatus Thioglobus sp.]|uniref:TM2 domain-containing protein n=1 Tax=Candidatus Thioglobus sp. TaxID=2026721 RepID=UPI003D150D35